LGGEIEDPVAQTQNFGLIRLDSTGAVDTTFGTAGDGKVITDFFSLDDRGRNVKVISGDEILAIGGTFISPTIVRGVIVKYRENGTVADNFGTPIIGMFAESGDFNLLGNIKCSNLLILDEYSNATAGFRLEGEVRSKYLKTTLDTTKFLSAVKYSYLRITSNYTVNNSDLNAVIIVDGVGITVRFRGVTLPENLGKTLIIKNQSTVNTVTIEPFGSRMIVGTTQVSAPTTFTLATSESFIFAAVQEGRTVNTIWIKIN